MNEPFRLFWRTALGMNPIANSYGYWTFNKMLYEQAAKLVRFDANARDVLTLMPPEQFIGVPERTNWLFTMFEGMDIPDIYATHLAMADYLLVPSNWVKSLFEPHFNRPIYVVNLGVSPFYTYKKRKLSLPFRFLWLGAPNPRKGYEELIAAWIGSGLFMNRYVEFHIKTTGYKVPYEKRGNIILDSRKLSVANLLKLYHNAHCFVFPSRGEGFGLTLAEAMRTGLPCISPIHTGITDFFDEQVGYSLDYRVDNSMIKLISRKEVGWIPTRTFFPNVDQLMDKMNYVMEHYDEALGFGRRAHERIRDCFTWSLAAENLVNVIRRERERGTVAA